MAKSNELTAAELKDLEAIGYVEGSPTIPENISPVLKAKLLDKWANDNKVANPSTDLPDATYRQNQIVRERAAADGDVEMQKATGVQEGAAVAGRQSEAASGSSAKPFGGKGDHDANGKTGGAKKA